jgi:Ca2+-binding RTX toxin-like protein
VESFLNLLGVNGNDDLFAGSDDRLMGGTGSDRVFALTGGTGADQFWIVEAAVPDRPHLITDFTSGEDAIAVGFPDLTFADLSLSQDGTSAIIGLNTATPIAALLDFQGNSLTENDFIFAEVPISET